MSGPGQTFEEGYIAMGYLLGARGQMLLEGLVDARPCALVERLGAPGKRERAAALAAQMLRLTRNLMGQRL
jgi:hypothetical protein